MIIIKTKEEIDILREGGIILAGVLKKVISEVRPGITTGELERLAVNLIKEAGGRPSFKHLEMYDGNLFPTALCTSINDEVVHAPALPSRELKSGDIICIDVGMEYPIDSKIQKVLNKRSEFGGYFTDMAATAMVGKVDKGTRKLVKTTREALEIAIDLVRPGASLNSIGKAIQKHVEKNGFSVVREMVGHGVGTMVHEDPQVPHYEVSSRYEKDVILEPGMVIAIEPMVNIGDWRIEEAEDGFTYKTKDGSLSAQFEHTIAVTDNGHIVITKL